MPIIVTITKVPESSNVAESTKTFDEQGGTIGRGADNAWILDDPERFLSSRHCQFSSENGQFYITDLSTNGTFFNGSVNPMGKGSQLPINDGNVFAIGDYEFSVSVNQSMQNVSADPFASSGSSLGGSLGDDIFSSQPADNGFGLSSNNNPFGGGHVSSSEPLFTSGTEETDPLAALDKAQGGSQAGGLGLGDSGFAGSASSADPFGGPTHSDQADPLNQQISWPNAVPENNAAGIPDDWDDDLMSAEPAPVAPVQAPAPTPKPAQRAPVPQPAASPAPSAPVSTQDNETMLAQQKANEKMQLELEVLKQQMNSQQRGVPSNVTVDTRLIEAMGLQNNNLVDAQITQMNQLVGEVMREMVGGLMQVLGSRSSIKNEFRMNVTTIQPVENNPLKFSANIDDALENMFIKQGNAYKNPVESVKDGFDGIAEHQVAILAGIRAAFKGVIERFDPILLEQRFAKQKKSGIMPSSQKAKNWELYLEYYNDLAGDIDNSFQYLFGDEFVQAYEDQLQQLVIARKQQNKTNE